MERHTKLFHIFFLVAIAAVARAEPEVDDGEEGNARLSKLLPVFQVVKFPNDPCVVSGGTRNGTCYTSEECSNKGGSNDGSCASGFGVCCTFALTCGSSSSENCTYFSVTPSTDGPCSAEICKVNSDICQIRLDFTTLVITGPSTTSSSKLYAAGGREINGVAPSPAVGDDVGDVGRCYTDSLTVTNQNTLPIICGTMSGYHVYFDASDDCNSINFSLGNDANGATKATRSWNIKVSQYTCGYMNRAPQGCDQWFYGNSGTGYAQSFNYENGLHLSDQRQTVCIRREVGKCRLCFSADSTAGLDVSEGGGTNGVISGNVCCGYGTKADAVDGSGAYDCVMIPAAVKDASSETVVPNSVCGSKGLVTAAAATQKTVCTKSYPFRIDFYSDSYEGSTEGGDTNAGFKLRFYQVSC